MKLNSLNNLIEHELQDLHSAETQILESLPVIMETCTSEDLKEVLSHHLAETEVHAIRLDEVADILKIQPDSKKCVGMEGLLKEGDEIIKEGGSSAVVDAALIGVCKKVEHYEMTAYTSLIEHLKVFEEKEIVELLKETLDEERIADAKLTSIAEAAINVTALEEM